MAKVGNPNWNKEQSAVLVTGFDKKVAELCLSPDQYLGSEALRAWSAVHKNTRYVPEPLLKAWGLFSDSQM